MTWQEEQFRRNQAEAAQTRARIAEGNARMAADIKASQTRDAAQRQADHKATMDRIARDGATMRSLQNETWNKPVSSRASTPSYPTSADSGTTRVTLGTGKTGKLNAILSVALLGIGALWLGGKIDGHAALMILAILGGLCVVIAVLVNLKKIIIGLFKLGLVVLIGYIIYEFISHH